MICAASDKREHFKKKISVFQRIEPGVGYESKLDGVMTLIRNQIKSKMALYVSSCLRSQAMGVGKMRLSHMGREEKTYQLSIAPLARAKY